MARRTLATVNSSAITARQPEVPNLICVGMRIFRARFSAVKLERDDGTSPVSTADRRHSVETRSAAPLRWRQLILYERQENRTHHIWFSGGSPENCPHPGRASPRGLRQHCAAD